MVLLCTLEVFLIPHFIERILTAMFQRKAIQSSTTSLQESSPKDSEKQPDEIAQLQKELRLWKILRILVIVVCLIYLIISPLVLVWVVIKSVVGKP